MRVCAFCVTSILQSPLAWDYHHKSWAGLKKSADEGCIFCNRIHQDVHQSSEALAFKENIHGWPRYRWSSRSLSKTSTTKEAVTITFRQIQRRPDQDLGTAKEEAVESPVLPTRTFCLFLEADLGGLPTLEKLGNSTQPTQSSSGAQIQSWIQECNRTHDICLKRRRTSGSNTFTPTRLLDIQVSAECPIKVIETKWTRVDSPYASLSHCWGKPDFVQLTTSNRKKFMEDGVPWSDLPINFQQAIEVARFLGVRYIWIDSLCIMQGTDGDFKTEANLMHEVYRNSHCNIAIADSPDSAGGAFRSRKPQEVVPVGYQASGESPLLGTNRWRIIPEDIWDSELLESVLYTRGWVFQERMLAPRILHFSRRQIFWDCPSMSACESLPAGLPQPLDNTAAPDRHWRGRLQEPGTLSHGPLAGPNDDSMIEFWQKSVRKYTSCNLTKGSDKMIAMWGIAKLVRDIRRVPYGFGLWKDRLEEQLAWRVLECKVGVRPNESSNEWVARDVPSWSWASMDGTIEVQLPNMGQVYAVLDHNQERLGFDLESTKPVKLTTRAPRRLPPQTRGWSDGLLEFLKEPEERGRRDGNNKQDIVGSRERTRSPDAIPEHEDEVHPGARQIRRQDTVTSQDDPPKFRSTSLAIQGHVRRGHIRWSASKRKWHLVVPDIAGTLAECFPDIRPSDQNSEELNTYFVILSVYIGLDEDQYLENDQKCFQIGQFEVPLNRKLGGVGILMKKLDDRRYSRTGAFEFSSISGEMCRTLFKDKGTDENFSGGEDSTLGLKFWLE